MRKNRWKQQKKRQHPLLLLLNAQPRRRSGELQSGPVADMIVVAQARAKNKYIKNILLKGTKNKTNGKPMFLVTRFHFTLEREHIPNTFSEL